MSDTRTISDGSHHTGDESGGSILGHIWAAIGATLVLGVIVCGIYPLIVYGIGQIFFPNQANGSLVKKDGTPTTDDSQAVGSSLIGQAFTAPVYFHPRPSAANNSAGSSYAAGGGYDATSSGGTNYGPLNDELINGQTATQPASQPATAPATTATATAPETTSAPSTTAVTPAIVTAAAAATAANSTTATTSAPSTQPVEFLAYDGIRLRVIHYALDNHIAFKLVHVKYNQDGAVIPDTKKELTPEEKRKFIDDKGQVTDDKLLVDAFPHMDMSGKEAMIAEGFATLIPADAVTASGSGLDPHISPDNAVLQAQRVVDERNKVCKVTLTKDQVLELIKQNTDRPGLGILGDPGVNVLMLNIALDKIAPLPAPTPTTTSASATAPAATAK